MKKWIIAIAVALGLLVLVGFGIAKWAVSKYNNLIAEGQNVDKSWGQVENVLQRRADLIPNLVNVVQAYAVQEQQVFINVAEARSGWMKAQSGGTVPDKIRANSALSGAIFNLMAVAESYPDLKSNQNFLSLQDELAGTENRIAVERMRYNEAVQTYNTYAKSFPNNLIVKFFDFKPERDFFEANDGAKNAPAVKINIPGQPAAPAAPATPGSPVTQPALPTPPASALPAPAPAPAAGGQTAPSGPQAIAAPSIAPPVAPAAPTAPAPTAPTMAPATAAPATQTAPAAATALQAPPTQPAAPPSPAVTEPAKAVPVAPTAPVTAPAATLPSINLPPPQTAPAAPGTTAPAQTVPAMKEPAATAPAQAAPAVKEPAAPATTAPAQTSPAAAPKVPAKPSVPPTVDY